MQSGLPPGVVIDRDPELALRQKKLLLAPPFSTRHSVFLSQLKPRDLPLRSPHSDLDFPLAVVGEDVGLLLVVETLAALQEAFQKSAHGIF